MLLSDVITQSVLSPKARKIVGFIEAYEKMYNDGPTTQEVARALDMTVNSVNYHLSELRRWGMLESHKESIQ